ncbi:MAG: hypoxanthine phosphoribosyltransferase [Armatimonadetes bacterium]|nr:hypoxanthine phosphoribosyltransferase [Armatimonadota bacterium]
MGMTEIEPIVTEAQIRQRVKEMAEEIRAAYPGDKPLLVAVLKGAVFFLADLCRALGPGFPIDFLSIKAYDGERPSGAVQIRLDLATDIRGRQVLLVEDIVDSGMTLTYLYEMLSARGPSGLRVAALLLKQEAYEGSVEIDFVGFRIPSRFVVGYGLDLNEEWRNLPFVGFVKS